MTNEYIEVVKRWRAGEVFSVEALQANADAAIADAYIAGAAAHAADAARTAFHAARAATYGYTRAAANADYWVKRYEELTNDK
tara:strand:- start:245 stop:493 length:249 start_codon:yes stop_codon:yes gene_type:complete